MCDHYFPEDNSAIEEKGFHPLCVHLPLYLTKLISLNWEYGGNAYSRVTNIELALFQATTLVSPNRQ